MSRLPDPIERTEFAIDRLVADYVDDQTCMGCGSIVDYELIVGDVMGAGPALCIECLGFDPHEGAAA